MEVATLETVTQTVAPRKQPPLLHVRPESFGEESALARRYTRSAEQEPLTFEFSTDEALLHQYYMLRERMFISTWGLKEFSAQEDNYDRTSDVLIVRRGNLCVGGARLTFSKPGDRPVLPMENPSFQLQQIFPDLDLEHKIYAECARMALLPEFRTKEVSFQIRHELIKHCVSKNADYAFWIAPLLQARNYRQTCVNLGYACKIRTDVEVPDREEYEGIKMYMAVLEFKTAPNGEAIKPAYAEELVTA